MQGNLHFKIDWASLIVGSNFIIFALFYFVFDGSFPTTSPWGAYIWRGSFSEFYSILMFNISSYCHNYVYLIYDHSYFIQLWLWFEASNSQGSTSQSLYQEATRCIAPAPPPHPYASSSQASSLSSRARFSRVPFSFQALKAVLCLLDLQSRSNFNNVESDTMKLSVNEAKLTGFWARNYATIQQVLILEFSFKPEKLLGLFKKCNPVPIYTIGCRVNRDKVEQSFVT